MNYPNYIDAEMRELLDALGAALTPKARQRGAWTVNLHAPYYSPGRYKRVA